MACEVPGNASRGLEKRSAVQGGFPVAEATVQATTSLPLHGMAGLYGLRPAPAMPGHGQRRDENNHHCSCKAFFPTGIAKMPPERLCWGHVRPSWGHCKNAP